MSIAASIDRRLELPWFRLTDAQGFVRIVTPLAETKQTAVPGIVRYRDGAGRVGFVDQVRYQSHKTRVKAHELASLLPTLSAHEVDRLFPRVAIEPEAAKPPARAPASRPAPRRGTHKPQRLADPRPAVEVVVRPRRTLVKDNH